MSALRVSACAILLTIASLAQAQDAAPAKAAKEPAAKAASQAKVVGKFGGWVLACPDEAKKTAATCRLIQELVHKGTKKRVFRLTVGYGRGGQLVLSLLAPVGLDLKRGIEFAPDGKKFYRSGFQTCLTSGCRAVVPLDKDLLKDMSSAKQGTLTVYALNGKALRAPVSIEGFSKGLEELGKLPKKG